MKRKKTKYNILNKREYELYMIIKDYIEQHQYSPSYRELLELSEYNSTSSIMLTLLKFEELGFIKISKDEKGRIKSRTIRVIYTSDIRKKLEEIESELQI